MQECTTAPARAKKARAPVKLEPIEAVAPEPAQSPYDAIADMGRQIEEGFRMLVDDTLVSDSSPLDVTIDFIRRHIREALWNFASPDIHTVNDGPIAWHDQMTMALDPMPDVLNIVLVAARQSKSPMAIKVLENLKGLIEAMNLALTHWDEETLALAFREVTEDERPAATAPAVAAPSPDPFRRGMDLALDMLRAGEHLNDPDVASCRRIDRGGRPQSRFAERYLRELVSAPAQLEGFAAVLSAAITLNLAGEGSDACAYRWLDVAQAEYQPGRPGDDGTVPDDGWVDAVTPRGHDWREKVVRLLREVKRSLEQAGDELSFVQPLGSAVQSASSLAKFMALGIEAALDQDPGPKWLEMLQEQDAELDGLCRLVDVLQGLAASRKGRQGFGALSEAFQLAQTAAVTFEAWMDRQPAGGESTPTEPVAAPATHEAAAPAAPAAAPSGTDVECELDRARVLLDILIDFAVNRADDDPLYVQERTIALASEARLHVVRANGGEA